VMGKHKTTRKTKMKNKFYNLQHRIYFLFAKFFNKLAKNATNNFIFYNIKNKKFLLWELPLSYESIFAFTNYLDAVRDELKKFSTDLAFDITLFISNQDKKKISIPYGENNCYILVTFKNVQDFEERLSKFVFSQITGIKQNFMVRPEHLFTVSLLDIYHIYAIKNKQDIKKLEILKNYQQPSAADMFNYFGNFPTENKPSTYDKNYPTH